MLNARRMSGCMLGVVSLMLTTSLGVSLAPVAPVQAGSVTTTGTASAFSLVQWRPLTATSADAFVETVGVNIHTGYSDTVYADQDRTLRLLKNLGVRHVRDALKADNRTMHAALRRLAQNGIGATLIAEPSGRFGAGALDEQIAALTDPRKLKGAVVAVEGPNELDCAAPAPDQARSQQSALAEAIAAQPSLDSVLLLAPAGCREVESIRGYGSDGAASDGWNLHAYPCGEMPEASATRQQVASAAAVEKQPVYVTETGYHNAVAGDGQGHNATSQDAAGPYAARLILTFAQWGVARTYLYELQDQRVDQSGMNRETAFGLVAVDGTPKPAYRYVQALLQTLADPGGDVADATVTVGFTGAPEDLRSVAFARADGSTDLVLWRAARLWDPVAKQPLTVPEVPVTVYTEAQGPGSVVELAHGVARVPVPGNGEYTVSVGASPVILRFGGAPVNDAAFEPSVGS